MGGATVFNRSSSVEGNHRTLLTQLTPPQLIWQQLQPTGDSSPGYSCTRVFVPGETAAAAHLIYNNNINSILHYLDMHQMRGNIVYGAVCITLPCMSPSCNGTNMWLICCLHKRRERRRGGRIKTPRSRLSTSWKRRPWTQMESFELIVGR